MRLILGIFLGVSGLLGIAFIASHYFGKYTWVVFGLFVSLMLLAGGGILTYLNKKRSTRKRNVTEKALKMLRRDGKIDTAALAEEEKLPEFDVRVYIVTSQRNGLIPFDADIS